MINLPMRFMMVVTRKSRSPSSIKLERYRLPVASLNSLAMALARVLAGLKMPFGTKLEFPMTMVTAMVSPRALPRERRIPAMIPDPE